MESQGVGHAWVTEVNLTEDRVLRLLAEIYINKYYVFSVEEEEAGSELKMESVSERWQDKEPRSSYTWS